MSFWTYSNLLTVFKDPLGHTEHVRRAGCHLDEVLFVLVQHEVVVHHVAGGDPVQQLHVPEQEVLRQTSQTLLRQAAQLLRHVSTKSVQI